MNMSNRAQDASYPLELESTGKNNNSSTLAHQLAQLTPTQRQKLSKILGQPSASGNEIIAQVLHHLGITHIYSIAGIPIDRALGHCAAKGIRVIGTRHQQGAALMAASQNYVTGKLVAAVMVSSGPAITNTLTGVLVAWDNAWPLVVIAGSSEGKPGTFQELQAIPLFAGITKAALRVSSSDLLVKTMVEATQIAITDRPGPVFVEIDEAVLTQSALSSLSHLEMPQWQAPMVDSHAIAQAAQLLKQANRPLLVIGKGVRWSEPYLELSALTAKGIPFISSPMGRGYLPDDALTHVTPATSLALGTADVVLSVGMRWNWTFRFGAELNKTSKLIQIDIHAPEIGCNVKPSLGIVSDAKTVLEALIVELSTVDWQSNAETQAWRERLTAACVTKHKQWHVLADETQSPLNLQTLMTAIADCLPRDAITVLDGNHTLEAGLRLLPCYQPASRLTPGTNGCMGTGLPFAIGAKIANPNRVVVAVCGDLAFGLAAMELETAIRHQIPVIIIVANNQGNAGSYRQKQFYGADYPERVTMFVPEAHYEAFALAFGGFGAEVRTAVELKTALQAAIAANVPACINVHLDPDSPSPI